jgi:hypothetical protein
MEPIMTIVSDSSNLGAWIFPDEITLHIFEVLMNDDDDRKHPLTLDLMRVCRSWYNLAMTPSLWTGIDVTGPTRRSEVMFQRSTPQEVVLSGTMEPDNGVQDMTWKVIEASRDRVKGVLFSNTDHATAERTLKLLELGERSPLRVLVMYGDMTERKDLFLDLALFHGMPKLRVVALVGVLWIHKALHPPNSDA